MSGIYHHQPEVWGVRKCERLAKKRSKDAFGTRDHLPGFLHGFQTGLKEYNGGCVVDDKWYSSEHFPMPTLPPGFVIEYEPSWFWRIRKTTAGGQS